MADMFSETLQTAVATQEEYQLPSIFEVLAQENLRASVRPAFEHLTKVLASYKPARFGWLLAWYDEIFTAIELLVQHHFLLAHIASYAEMYYGLRRKIKGLKVQSHNTLGTRRHFLTLVTLCIIPYIEEKLKKMYDKIADRRETQGNQCTVTIMERLIFRLYPIMFSSWEFWKLYLQFKYAIHENKYPDPFLKLLRIKLVVEDPQAASQASGNVVSRALTKMIAGGVHAGVFVLQFIDWFYHDANQATVQKLTQAPIPLPPHESCDKTIIPVRDNITCPLCNRRRTNDTALFTSGYVFCYVCIFKYVKNNSKCPVTGYPTTTECLIKIYRPE
ncbi:peroxisome assembly protein 12-B-like [Styela clava]